MSESARVRIFIDFWNLQIQWNTCHAKQGTVGLVQIPWKDLPKILTAEAASGHPAKYAGCQVYASIDEEGGKETRTQQLASSRFSCLARIFRRR